jgi:hypothetical protein
MNKKFKINLTIILLVTTLFLLPFISSAYERSNVAYTASQGSAGFFGFFGQPNQECKDVGQDFVVQIVPFGCTPAIVRSDLLAEQDVPVFCQLIATKINPLIDVNAIESLSIVGGLPEGVKDVGYMPARDALRTDVGKLNNPVSNNIGYAVIVLKQQKNEKNMSDKITGKLNIQLKYNIKNAFGLGDQSFYLPETTDLDWETNYLKYSFWKGKAYVRAEEIDNEGARISIYNGVSKLQTFNLKKGDTSNVFYMPGFDCLAGLKVKLNNLENPETRVKLNVNGDNIEVKQGEKFLNNHCYILNIEKNGFSEKVELKCDSNSFTFLNRPKVNITIDGVTNEYSLGDNLTTISGDKKNIFLGYIGESKEGVSFIVPVVSPAKSKEEFLDSNIYKVLPGFVDKTIYYTGSKVIDIPLVALQSIFGIGASAVSAVGSGAYPLDIYPIDGKELTMMESAFHNSVYISRIFDPSLFIIPPKITFNGFATPKNFELTNETLDYYNKAIADYDYVIRSLPETKYSDNTNRTLGERAFIEKIKLAFDSGQKLSVLDMCEEFKRQYPNSDFIKELDKNYCADKVRLSSDSLTTQNVKVGNEIKEISFEGIIEPTLNDYSVEVTLRGNGVEYSGKVILGKNDKVYVSDSEYISLSNLDTNWAEFDLSGVNREIGILNTKIQLGKTFSFGKNNQYAIKIDKINLKKVALVTLLPEIDRAGTKTNVSFDIGIEKRGIQLTPDELKKKIDTLNQSISEWESKSNKLGTVVKGLKASCLGVNLYLTAKNFLANTNGKSIARQAVMRGDGGWYNKCAKRSGSGKEYSSIDKCLSANSDNINNDVDAYSKELETQNSEIKTLQNNYAKTDVFGTKTVNTEEFCKAYASKIKSSIGQNLKDKLANGGETAKIGNEDIDLNKFVNNLDCRNIPIEDLRDLELHSRISGSDDFNARMKERLSADVKKIYTDTKLINEAEDFSTKSGLPANVYSFGKEQNKIPFSQTILFSQVKNNFDLSEIQNNLIADDASVQSFKDAITGEQYVLVLDKKDNVVSKTYKINGNNKEGKLILEEDKDGTNPLKLQFQKYDSSSYNNPYQYSQGENVPILRYYETDPYKGLPAIVPFDKNQGWYVSIKQTLPIGSSVRSYDESGRVNSFYLCNIGSNKIEENKGGDDICEMINTGTGMPYNQFPGLSSSDSIKLVNDAVKAIEQASKQYTSGVKIVRIDVGRGVFDVKVGSPAADIPDMKCEDFMSPADCKLLFNVCDPVICPSSRCDLGGAYPVKDVIQSGIFGSLALCLPNFPEVYVPVCLTGVQAGIDGWLSVQKSYRDCLQQNLATGETVGICDELHSVYMCEFFWKQGVPLARLAIPKLLEVASGQGSKGGGEYLGIQTAWQNAEQSTTYFTQYYAANSYKAFKARSLEDAGTEVCKLSLSGTFPTGDTMLDSLTTPDSPSQFTGRFDEIPYTTATNPPISHYKVFYHIYAGKDRGAYYKVYLKGGAASSYYQDTASTLYVPGASGYIANNGYKSDTVDFTAPSGYKEMCIMVNDQEECGFKQVSTDFALNYIQDEYLAQQANASVKSESECISGTPSLSSLVVNPNIQSGVESVVNPQIYNYGITRICATKNPGLGSDDLANIDGSRWVDVGYCTDKTMRCWLDTNSVKDAIKNTNIQGEVLDEKNKDFMTQIAASGNYITDLDGELNNLDFSKIDKENILKNINNITNLIPRVLFNNQKGYLIFLRGGEYGKLVKNLYEELKKKEQEKAKEKIVIPEISIEQKIKELRGMGINVPDGISIDQINQIYERNKDPDFFTEYPFFKFIPSNSNEFLYYQYDAKTNFGKAGVWWWTKDKSQLYFVPTLESDDGVKAPQSQWDIITALHGNLNYDVNYEDGLRILVDSTLKTKDSKLVTDSVELSNNEVKVSGEFDLYLKYDNNAGWTIIASKMRYGTYPPIGKSLDLFNSLNGKDLYDGLAIIFSRDMKDIHNIYLQDQIVNEFGIDVFKLIQGKTQCSDCDGGIWGVCRENECSALSKYLGRNCVYEDKFFLTSGGTCSEKVIESKYTFSKSDENIVTRIVGLAINYKDSKGNPRPIVNSNCANYIKDIVDVTNKNNLPDPLLLVSLMQQESSCDPTAFSGSSVGLMQINLVHCGQFGLPSNKDECKKRLIEDTSLNIDIGAKILREGYDVSNNDYQMKVEKTCKVAEYRTKYLLYSDWEKAVRLYNGAGCTTGAEVNFVEEVLSRFNRIQALS